MPFAALGRQQLTRRHILLAHHSAALMRADYPRAGVLRNQFGAGDVVEMGMANQHEVSAVHLRRAQTDFRRRGDPVHVGIEENDRFAKRETKRRATEPIQLDVHASPPATDATGSHLEGHGEYRYSVSSKAPQAEELLAGVLSD